MSGARVGAPAPEVLLRGADERPVPLSELWREGPVVLVWLRHFG